MGTCNLTDISMIAGGEGLAVGYCFVQDQDSIVYTPNAFRWDGEQWAAVVAPDFHFPGAVVMLAPNDAWAVGGIFNGEGLPIQHWNGETWSTYPIDDPSGNGNAGLGEITATAGGVIWTFGGYNTPPDPEQTLYAVQIRAPFADVGPMDPFYSDIKCLTCNDVISGYANGTFQPGNQVTRGQLAKIVSNAAGYTGTPSGQTFADVLPDSPFYTYIERIASRGVVSGYACGVEGEPCDGQQRPYFRPGANMSRGQLAKVTSNARGYDDQVATSQQTFKDVPPGHTFWLYIERAAHRGVISGYACGGEGEPCPGSYFRPQANVTRGQASKIVANTFFPGCEAP
jgi:hypothetical protein